MPGMFNGLKKRVLWAGLLPVQILVLSTCLLSALLASIQLHQRFIQQSHVTSEQIGLITAAMLTTTDNNSAETLKILRSALQYPDVYSLRLVSDEGQILYQAGPPFSLAIPEGSLAQRNPMINQGSALLITSPVQKPDTNFWLELEFTERELLLSEYQWYLLIITLTVIILLITTVTMLRLSNSLSFPLERLTTQISQIDLHNLHTRLTTDDNGDLRPLQLHINHLLARIQSRYRDMKEEVERASDEIQKNMETLEVKNAELDYSRKQAVEANQSKSMFLANISHEMHTPLNSILGYCSLLEKTTLKSQQREHLHTLKTSAHTLKAIISDILDFSKIQAGKLSLEHIPFNLQATVNEALAMNSPSAHSKNLDLSAIFHPDVPHNVVGDSNRLKQIISNLLSNAIKFTRQGSVVIEINCQRQMEDFAEIRVVIKDTGIGISREDGRRLFQAFSRVDSSLNRNSDGTGLGLVICKSLVKQMRGEIDFNSEPGKGSNFWFTIFLALDHQLQPDHSSALTTVQPVNRPQNSNLHILAVDDNVPNLKLLTTILEEMGIKVDGVSSGYEAIEKVCNNNYQMIFMDIRMPGMDGIEATRRIRDLTRHNKYLPIVALTAHAMMDERTRLLTSCFDDYQTKPVNEQQLLHLINYWTQPVTGAEVSTRFPRENPVTTTRLPLLPSPAKSPVDHRDGLLRTEGRQELAEELLNMLLDSLPAVLAEIEQFPDRQALEELHESVHKLHGATHYCGVPDLRTCCEALINQLESGEMEDDQTSDKALTAAAVDSLKQEIERLLVWRERARTSVPF